MEAFTVLFELTREARHRQALEQVSELIFDRLVVSNTGCGISLFSPDWTPIPNEQLSTVWGADRFDEVRKPADITSFGHNIELAWLFLRSLDILGIPRHSYLSRVEPLFRHCSDHGVDREHGGIYVEGRRGGEVTDTDKEFWQQAEALVGFLDALALTQDERYWTAFCRVHDFVFSKMINWPVGEWFALLSREGQVKRDYMGSNWKICYHTLRSMILVVDLLKKLI
jgi:mannobiose 2-epimerase